MACSASFRRRATITFSSDLYLLAALGRANRYIGMQGGHNRQGLDGGGGRGAPLLPPLTEPLSLEDLVTDYCLNGAYQLCMDEHLGSIEVGKTADFVVLRDNLFEMNRYNIHQAKVDLTLMEGKVIFKHE